MVGLFVDDLAAIGESTYPKPAPCTPHHAGTAVPGGLFLIQIVSTPKEREGISSARVRAASLEQLSPILCYQND